MQDLILSILNIRVAAGHDCPNWLCGSARPEQGEGPSPARLGLDLAVQPSLWYGALRECQLLQGCHRTWLSGRAFSDPPGKHLTGWAGYAGSYLVHPKYPVVFGPNPTRCRWRRTPTPRLRRPGSAARPPAHTQPPAAAAANRPARPQPPSHPCSSWRSWSAH
jgi:hypothetical protein